MRKRRANCVWAIPVLVAGLACWPGGLAAGAGSEVIRATLKNGLRVVIVRNALAPVATTQVNYLVGSDEAPPGYPGTAHAQEHMTFRGSAGLSAAQLSTIAAALGGDFNADTQQTVTQYFSTVPADQLEVALHMQAIQMRGVLDGQKAWDEERGAIEQEVSQDLSNPEYVFQTRLLAHMYAGTPYAHDALGTRPSFRKTTGAMLRKFYDAWYAPNNAVLVIVGDVDPAGTLAMVKRLFEPIPARRMPARPRIRLRPLRPATIRLETDLPYGLAVVAYRLPGYDSPDYAAGQVLADVLDSRRGSLYGLVPGGKALSADFNSDPLPKAALGYSTAAFPKGGDGAALVGHMKGIIADTVQHGVPPDLVEAAKRHEIADAEFRRNSVAGLADAWSQALAVEGRHSPDDDIEALKQVTVGDVDRVARQYLVNETAAVSVLTPRASGKPVASSGVLRQESFTPKVAKPVAVPAWAKMAVALPSIPTSHVHPTVTLLPNGLQLIVQRETVSPTVSVYGRVKNNPDLEAPKGQEGVDQALDGLFAYGTTTLDRLAFQKAVDDIGADLSVGASFSLRVLADRFDRGAELLAQNLLHPALPEAAFPVVQQQTSGELAGRLQSPGYLSHRALRAALFPKGDPTLRQATPETVASLTLDDVKTYYHKAFRPDLTTIVVIGDVTPAQAQATIGKYFGGWTAAGPKPETDLPPAPPNRAATTAVPDASRVQDKVTLAQTLGLTRTDPDYYPLEVGRNVVAGDFFAARLYRDLRERTGLVYTVGALLDAGKTRSVFAIVYASDPSRVSRARALVDRDLRQMQTAPATPVELERAKMLLLRRIPLSESSTARIAAGLLDRSLKDLPLDEPTRAARRYLNITAAEVQTAFARWIRPDDLVQVTLGPRPA